MASTYSPYLVFAILFLFSFSEAKEFLVGGKTDAWKIPSSPSESVNQWAQGSRFQVGDSIVWKYNATQDSVLQVSRKDYANCNISSPIAQFNDGNTKVKLQKPGPYYFISGAEGHCVKGQKLIVVVMTTPRGAATTKFVGISPAPSPTEFAVAPSSGGASGLTCGLVVTLGSLLGMVLVV